MKSEQNSQAISINSKVLRNLLTSDSLKSFSSSRFASALAKALQRIDQSLPLTKMYAMREICH